MKFAVAVFIILMSIQFTLAESYCGCENSSEKSANFTLPFNITLPNITVHPNQTESGNFTDIINYIPYFVAEKINFMYTLFIDTLKSAMKETLRYFAYELIDYLFPTTKGNVTENRTVA